MNLGRSRTGLSAIILGSAFFVFGFLVVAVVLPDVLSAAFEENGFMHALYLSIPVAVIALPLFAAGFFICRHGMRITHGATKPDGSC